MTDLPIYVCLFLALLLAFVVGVQVGRRGRAPEEAGYFILNYDNPNKEFMTLKLEKDLPEIEELRYISFEVIVQGSPISDTENSPGKGDVKC